jgi:hypothetical protein
MDDVCPQIPWLRTRNNMTCGQCLAKLTAAIVTELFQQFMIKNPAQFQVLQVIEIFSNCMFMISIVASSLFGGQIPAPDNLLILPLDMPGQDLQIKIDTIFGICRSATISRPGC